MLKKVLFVLVASAVGLGCVEEAQKSGDQDGQIVLIGNGLGGSSKSVVVDIASKHEIQSLVLKDESLTPAVSLAKGVESEVLGGRLNWVAKKPQMGTQVFHFEKALMPMTSSQSLTVEGPVTTSDLGCPLVELWDDGGHCETRYGRLDFADDKRPEIAEDGGVIFISKQRHLKYSWRGTSEVILASEVDRFFVDADGSLFYRSLRGEWFYLEDFIGEDVNECDYNLKPESLGRSVVVFEDHEQKTYLFALKNLKVRSQLFERQQLYRLDPRSKRWEKTWKSPILGFEIQALSSEPRQSVIEGTNLFAVGTVLKESAKVSEQALLRIRAEGVELLPLLMTPDLSEYQLTSNDEFVLAMSRDLEKNLSSAHLCGLVRSKKASASKADLDSSKLDADVVAWKCEPVRVENRVMKELVLEKDSLVAILEAEVSTKTVEEPAGPSTPPAQNVRAAKGPEADAKSNKDFSERLALIEMNFLKPTFGQIQKEIPLSNPVEGLRFVDY